jgi:N-acetyl-1-D-myo-inositol-2-amino-2-deoxy-alpha-D-glucopyranoside deacetylase
MPGLLLVHAHPDDEVIGTGASMAKYAAEGREVTLVTCTRGEEGEILVEAEQHRAADQDDTLGDFRMGELAAALDALGVKQHRWLGGAGKYRDSGMMGTPANDKPHTFWQASAGDTTRDMVEILRDLRPEVVITYDEFGGYGHPDHIRAHQTAVAGIAAAADETYEPSLGAVHQVAKLYYMAMPKSWIQASIDAMKAADLPNFFEVESADDLPFGTPDDQVTTVITASDYIDHKVGAMRAHKTQIDVEGGFFALSNGIGRSIMGTEAFTLAQGASGPLDDEGHETDLFAGL